MSDMRTEIFSCENPALTKRSTAASALDGVAKIAKTDVFLFAMITLLSELRVSFKSMFVRSAVKRAAGCSASVLVIRRTYSQSLIRLGTGQDGLMGSSLVTLSAPLTAFA